ncbi:hypothetical protein QGP82_14055 [Leptothoe sp. LEGE 181152]|nr:hypothetical protein [Leptothoe sp. LEGE 181152]
MSKIKTLLFEKMKPELGQAGFNLVKTRNWFIRKQNQNVSFVFWIVSYKDQGNIRITPTTGVRFNNIEDIFHQCAGFDEKYKKYTLTLVSEIWRWKKTETSYQYILKSEDNVQDIAIQIVHDFWEDALKYYESYATLSQVDSELNNDPSGECIHQIMDFARCSRGIIAAKLCNRHNYEKLVQIYRERMSNQDKGFYLSSFDCIVNLLSC